MSRRFLYLLFALLAIAPEAARADLPSPAVVQTIPTQTLGRAGLAQMIYLYSYINDPNIPGTAVRINVQVGNVTSGFIDLALADQQTPQTVANFLTYINGGYFQDNIIHRSVAGFIIQGGEYYFTDYANDKLAYVAVGPAVQNEPGISNVAGTIAMAKVSGNVNSATNQWFINMADNSSNLDNQNGGFTVFGRVIGSGMTVANTVNGLPTYNGTGYAPDWTDIPLTAANGNNTSFVRTSMAVVPAVTYNVTSGNTSLVTASLSGNMLTLTPSSTNTGSTNVTVTTTDLEGGVLQTNISVSVVGTFDNLTASYSLSGNAANITATPANDGMPNLTKYAFGGNPLTAQRPPGLPQIQSDGGGITFYQQQQTSLNYVVQESTDLVNWTQVWQTSDGYSSSAVSAKTLNIAAGFDSVTIRNPSPPPGTLHFWRVVISRVL